jgi:hypothetical protein
VKLEALKTIVEGIMQSYGLEVERGHGCVEL